jgi:hypothetical protein
MNIGKGKVRREGRIGEIGRGKRIEEERRE